MSYIDEPLLDFCAFNFTRYCRTHPCTEAQGVRCCKECPYRKNCKSRCGAVEDEKEMREE